MSKIVVAGLICGVVLSGAAQDGPPTMPTPQKEHEWLHQLVGEWDVEGECFMDPSKPAKFKGSESGRKVGGFWVVLENKGEFMGAPFTGILSLGYNPEKKRYVGTWLDSMGSHLWQYTGTVNASGNALTLETEGPCPQQPGKLVKHRETIEVKSREHKVFTSATEVDGQWVTSVTLQYRRK